MVVALGPGKFYGSSLPRPRFYTDIKFSDERVDPPIPVMEPFMEWAKEAHWSMGGLSTERHRLQGRIEGNVKKLRAEREKFHKETTRNSNKVVNKRSVVDSAPVGSKQKVRRSPSPPPAPVAIKRRRYLGLVDDDSEEEEEREVVRKTPARKLSEEFDRVAAETGMRKKRISSSNNPAKSSGNGSEGVGLRTRSRRSEQVEEKDSKTPTNGSRKTPRLVKRWTK